jgi:hypothetical protein
VPIGRATGPPVRQPLRNEHFDLLSDELGWRVTEHVLGALVDLDDDAGVVDHEQRVG